MDLNEQRLDYAWKWFNFHADQRTKMFNFMLVGLGLIASALVVALDKEFVTLARALGIAGFLISLLFWRIDFRNKQLYEAALDILFELERSHLFPGDGMYEPKLDGNKVTKAISWRIYKDDLSSGTKPSFPQQFWQGRHRRLMPAVILGLGLLFLLVGLNACDLSKRVVQIANEPTKIATVPLPELKASGASEHGAASAMPFQPSQGDAGRNNVSGSRKP